MEAMTLTVLPVLLPLAAIVANLLLGEGRGNRLIGLNIGFSVGLVIVSAGLLVVLLAQGETAMAVYSFGNWPLPFGIVFVADRLAAVMVMTTSVLAMSALLFAAARWYRAGTSFFPLFHALTMGLNGAFLTGDLFNLFVFFEVLLAASYGLVLHGSGRNRVRSALHYIVVNLVASSLFLVGVALIYGSVGTLNMADIARRATSLAAQDRGLFEVGASVLGVAFLIKAGAWPLHFWLPPAYSSAVPPVAALFTIMTKVGFYVILRLKTLTFGEGSEFGELFLLVIGLATIAYGSIGALSSKALDRFASYLVLVSAGTLLLAAAYNVPGVTAGALLYLIVATFAAGAMFLLKDIIDQALPPEAQVLAISLEFYGEEDEEGIDEDEEVSPTVPTGATLIGACFAVAAILLAGLPPLSGFLAKFVMISSAFSSVEQPEAATWWFASAIIASGLLVLVAMVRNGINIFWSSLADVGVRVRVLEIVPVIMLLTICVVLTMVAAPVLDVLSAAAAGLYDPQVYITGVLGPQGGS